MDKLGIINSHLGADDYLTIKFKATEYLHLQINYNQLKWAVLPVFVDETNADQRELMCQLPALEVISSGVVDVLDPQTKTLLWSQSIENRQPLRNGHGLLATKVLETKHSSLTTSPWMTFNGVTLTLSGYHLPPLGNPELIGLQTDNGVVYKLKTGMKSPSHKSQFWYWPNSYFSGFTIEINLLATSATSDPLNMMLIDLQGDVNGGFLPKYLRYPADLRSFLDFPVDIDQIARVQSNDLHAVNITGYQAYRGFEDLLIEYNVLPVKGVTILDWGCGHGRVMRHFVKHWPRCEIWGGDIDSQNVQWAQNHIIGSNCQLLPLFPPSKLPAGKFDAIYGLSVMTHLTAEAQTAWINELARCLKPGGLALLTYDGPTVDAYSSVFRSEQWWDEMKRSGFNDEHPDPALGHNIDDQTYYRVTHQSESDVRQRWSGPFEVIKTIRDAFGNQDVAVLRKKN